MQEELREAGLTDAVRSHVYCCASSRGISTSSVKRQSRTVCKSTQGVDIEQPLCLKIRRKATSVIGSKPCEWILMKVVIDAIVKPGYPALPLKRFHGVNVCEHTDEAEYTGCVKCFGELKGESWVWECEQGKSSQVLCSDQRNLFNKKGTVMPFDTWSCEGYSGFVTELSVLHFLISCKYFCVSRAALELFCCLWSGCDRKEPFRYFCGGSICAFINIFCCKDNNPEVSLINSTLPLADVNKRMFAKVVQQLCGRESVENVWLSVWHICEKLFLDCVMYLMFFMSWR